MNAAATARTFSPGVLELDAYAEVQRIAAHLRETVGPRLRRKGAVVAVSGGVDSAVCAALAVRALGRERVFALLLPERDSSSRSTELGRRVCDELGVQYVVEDIA